MALWPKQPLLQILAREFLAIISYFLVANPRDGRVTHCGQPREAFWSVDTEVQVSLCDAGVLEFYEGRVLFASENVWCAEPPTFDCGKGVVLQWRCMRSAQRCGGARVGLGRASHGTRRGSLAEASLRHAIALLEADSDHLLACTAGVGWCPHCPQTTSATFGNWSSHRNAQLKSW